MKMIFLNEQRMCYPIFAKQKTGTLAPELFQTHAVCPHIVRTRHATSLHNRCFRFLFVFTLTNKSPTHS